MAYFKAQKRTSKLYMTLNKGFFFLDRGGSERINHRIFSFHRKFFSE